MSKKVEFFTNHNLKGPRWCLQITYHVQSTKMYLLTITKENKSNTTWISKCVNEIVNDDLSEYPWEKRDPKKSYCIGKREGCMFVSQKQLSRIEYFLAAYHDNSSSDTQLFHDTSAKM